MKNYHLSERIIEKTFYIAIECIKKISPANDSQSKIETLDRLPEGTLGKEIATCLKANGLDFVPQFESHDLKHVLLGFEMTPLDEIRLQAFMLGNGNWTIPSLLIFMYGALFLPTKWRCFGQDYQAGKRAIAIKDWSIEDFAERPLEELRDAVLKGKELNLVAPPQWTLRAISMWGSYAVIFAGIFGMLFCFPFLWSSNIADLIGAGFPFVAGAILVIGGLINLSILSKNAPMPFGLEE